MSKLFLQISAAVALLFFLANPKMALKETYQVLVTPTPRFFGHVKQKHEVSVSPVPTEAERLELQRQGLETIARATMRN